MPSFQNLKWGALPENTRYESISVEDCLDLHFSWRLTLAIAVFKPAFLTPALFAPNELGLEAAEFVDLRRRNCLGSRHRLRR